MLSRPLAQPSQAPRAQHVSRLTAPCSNPLLPTSGLQHLAIRRGHAWAVACPAVQSSHSRWPLLRHPRRRHVTGAAPSGRGGGADEEPDWEAEMSIFKQRISRPNQLATLRELEAKVSVGKVLYARDGLAIVSGLNSDAPLGTKVSFATGTAGVLLWHRSDNLSFCLVLGDPATVTEGTPVECKIKGVLQVVDDAKGPITRKDYELFTVPTGEEVFGRVADHIGRHLPEFDAGPAAASSSGSGSGGGGSGSGGGGPGKGSSRPLINQQVEMKNREQINEPLLTGVKALDILTPLGRGASLLVIGPGGAGKTRLALDAVAGQAAAAAAAARAGAAAGGRGGGGSGGSGAMAPVRCVLALVGRPKAEVQAIVSDLRACGSLANTAVVAADEGAPLGHQFAAMCCACSIGERVRDEGGHSLVVVDDLQALSDVWEQLLGGLSGLGAELLREGLVKDERGRDMPVVPPPGAPGTAPGASSSPTGAGTSTASSSGSVPASAPSGPAASAGAAGPAGASSSRPTAGPSSAPASASAGAGQAGLGSSSAGGVGGSGGLGGEEEEEGSALVEYEGMLVSGAVAQRRGFLSTFFQRAAKMSRSNGGGSMSLLPLVPGTCATGVSKRIDMSKYKTLTPEQLAKLEAALRAKQLAEELAAGAASGELATEVVEEFISIADGQVVLDRPAGQQQQGAAGPSSSPAYTINPKLSISRIGTRAFHKAMEQLAPQVRLDLAQADDARRFRTSASGSSLGSSDLSGSNPGPATAPATHGSVDAEARADALAQRLSAALLQRPGRPVLLAEQVVTLYAVQRGFADAVSPEHVPAWLEAAVARVVAEAPGAVEEIGRTGILTAASEAAIAGVLRSFRWRP